MLDHYYYYFAAALLHNYYSALRTCHCTTVGLGFVVVIVAPVLVHVVQWAVDVHPKNQVQC
jgi:hypothetical protein